MAWIPQSGQPGRTFPGRAKNKRQAAGCSGCGAGGAGGIGIYHRFLLWQKDGQGDDNAGDGGQRSVCPAGKRIQRGNRADGQSTSGHGGRAAGSGRRRKGRLYFGPLHAGHQRYLGDRRLSWRGGVLRYLSDCGPQRGPGAGKASWQVQGPGCIKTPQLAGAALCAPSQRHRAANQDQRDFAASRPHGGRLVCRSGG